MGRELAIGFTSWGFPLVWSCNNDSTSTHWTHESRKLKLQVILGKASICPGLAFSFGGVCQVLTSTYSTLQTSFSHTWVWLFIDLKKHPHPPFFAGCEPSNIQGLVIFFHPFTVSCAQVEALIFQMIQSLPIVGGEKIFLKKARTCFWRTINDHPILKILFNQENSKYTKSMSWPSEYLPWRGSFSVARPY